MLALRLWLCSRTIRMRRKRHRQCWNHRHDNMLCRTKVRCIARDTKTSLRNLTACNVILSSVNGTEYYTHSAAGDELMVSPDDSANRGVSIVWRKAETCRRQCDQFATP